MTALRKLALVLVGLLVTALIADTVIVVTTGTRTVVTDNTGSALGPPWLGTVTAAALIVTVGLLLLIVRGERHRFAQAPAPARWAYPVLLFGLAALFVGTVVIAPLLRLLGIEGGPWMTASDAAAALCLAALFGSCLVIGLATLRRNPLGVGARVLALIVPAGLVTLVLGLIDPAWASPMLLTATVLAGVALLGVGAPSRLLSAPESRRVGS